MAKQINTRILLKYDSYENWSASTLILKKGEAAICELANSVNTSAQPTILIKYGDGVNLFSALPWSSALAADVYAWAKASGIKTEEVIADGAEEANGSVKVLQRAEFASTTENPNGALVFTYAYAANASDITAALEGYATTAYVDAAVAGGGPDLTNYATIAYVDENDIAILAAAQEYTDANNTTYTLAYETKTDEHNARLVLTPSTGEVQYIDATPFIKDGMLDTVAYDADTNTLTFTFNTDAGKEAVSVALTDIFAPYTGFEGDRVTITIIDNVISADLVEGSIAKSYLDTSVQDSLAKADSALQESDISHLAIASEVLTRDAVVLAEAQAYADGINTALDTRIAALETTGGQVNVIEEVQVNGTALAVANKAVNIALTTDDIAAGTETWIFNCGGAEVVE